jgi:hypothetical protein
MVGTRSVIDLKDLENSANGERVLVDELRKQRPEALRGHA